MKTNLLKTFHTNILGVPAAGSSFCSDCCINCASTSRRLHWGSRCSAGSSQLALRHQLHFTFSTQSSCCRITILLRLLHQLCINFSETSLELLLQDHHSLHFAIRCT